MRETSFKIISDNNIYTIFPALLRTTNGSTFSLNKLNFSSIYINEIDPIVENYEETEENAKGDLVSCFETDENIIICFYNCFYGKIFGHCISSFNYTFEKLNSDFISGTTKGKGTFFCKCTHYKDEIGVFTYFNEIVGSTFVFPYFEFISYNNTNNTFDNYMEKIIIDKMTFSNDTQLNDLIKISDDKICFISTSFEKQFLFIIIFTIIEKDEIIIRYYSIDLFLYNLKIYVDLSIILYNDLITLTFSFTKNIDINDIKYSGFMIFGYPNSTDNELDLEDYLLEFNNITINNIIFYLKKI